MSILDNRKARQYYEFLDFLEAGIVLTGPEVKSIKKGQVSFADSYIEFKNNEAYITGLHISPYAQGGYAIQTPDRQRKLLLHSTEIYTFSAKVDQKGLTVVPVKIYLKRGKIKLEIALARGRKLHDQRQELKNRAEKRDLERELASK